ncbi:MAG: ABC transporter permease subunit [Clostridiaceae bacterium]
MNLYKRELRAGLKAFIFWLLGMFVLCFAGIIKFESYSTSGSMMELINSFPRVVLAVMGAVGVDAGTLGGYTALLFYYVLICAVIYAVYLGSAAVTRESVDKTYEFVFTKPCSRARVLGLKLAAAYTYLLLFCAANGLFAVLAVKYLGTSENITRELWLCALSVLLIGALFVAAAAFFAAVAKRPEKGAVLGNLAFLYAFIMGVVFNILEHPGLLRLISPFSYFTTADLASAYLSPAYAALSLALSAVLLMFAFIRFGKKDLL